MDDLIWSGTELFQKNIIDHIRNKIGISKKETQAFRDLGLNAVQKKDVNLYSSERVHSRNRMYQS